MICKVTHAGKISAGIEVLAVVRQGCLLSPLLFLLAINWITRKTTANKRNAIQWTLLTQLNDLSYADDLALLLAGENIAPVPGCSKGVYNIARALALSKSY